MKIDYRQKTNQYPMYLGALPEARLVLGTPGKTLSMTLKTPLSLLNNPDCTPSPGLHILDDNLEKR